MSQKGRTLVDSTSVTHPDQSFMETESGAVVARAGGQSIGSGVAGDTGKAAVVVLRGRTKQTG